MSVEALARLPAPARRALYFGLQALAGSRVGPAWREFLAWERLAPAALERAVEERLGGLLERAVSASPHYRQLGLARRAGEPARDFLRRFPILDRETIRARFADLVAEPLRTEATSPEAAAPPRYGWAFVKTGGTTGNPTTVVHDRRQRDWGRAARLFSARQCGHPLGTPYFKLWGSEHDLARAKAALHLRVQAALLGEVPLNAFRAREEDLLRHHATLLARPGVRSMMAYVDAAVGLALFIEDRGLPRPSLRTLMACAGTVTPEWRAILERVFGAEVFDKYGSRECGDLACECREHQGLHVYSPNAFVEVVDGNGAPCPAGAAGRILVTLLNNPGFPMVRYDIGDLGRWAETGPCPCGCAWPRLAAVEGRADEMLLTEDGTLLSSVFVRHFVGVSLNRQVIREWQLEQTGRGEFVFRYAPAREDGLADNLAKLDESFRAALGAGAKVEMARVAEVPQPASGKRRWIINRVAGRPPPSP